MQPQLESIAGDAMKLLKQEGVKYEKRKLAEYVYGKMFGKKKKKIQQGSGMKGRKKRKTAKRRVDVFT